MRVRTSWVGWIGALGLSALGAAALAAQDEPAGSRAAPQATLVVSEGGLEGQSASDQHAPRSASGRNVDGEAARDAPVRYFFDDFSNAALEERTWERYTGATPTHDLLDQGRSVPVVRLSMSERGVDRQPRLRSVAIDLAGLPGAELTYTVQHHGVEAGEQLLVDYLSEDGRWYTIERVVAEDWDSVGFSRHMHVLPADALHSAFRIRFRPKVDDVDDAWYLGEVAVSGYEPLHTLAVDARPARSVRVEVYAADPPERLDGTVPFTRSLLAGRPVHLVAPPAVDEWVFSHWTVDGVAQADRQRVLTLEPREGAEVIAHYRLWVPGRSEATVVVVSTPEPGVRIALGTDPTGFYADLITEARHRCLKGEWLALLAPPRSERLAFAGWFINGQLQPSGANLLEHRVAGDDVLVAEYVLLGDMNGDDELDKLDVDEFVLALVDPVGYARRYPDLDRIQRGDINGDGEFDALDVEDFVDLLLSD